MFNNCKSLSSLPDISKWNTNNVSNMSYMFNNCESLLSLPDISKWKINKVLNLSYMFNNCESLLSLPDISKWKIYSREMTNYNYIFRNSYSILFPYIDFSIGSINKIELENNNNLNKFRNQKIIKGTI